MVEGPNADVGFGFCVGPYVCDHPGCGKAFAIAGALTIHRRTHSGHKPFKCTYCEKYVPFLHAIAGASLAQPSDPDHAHFSFHISQVLLRVVQPVEALTHAHRRPAVCVRASRVREDVRAGGPDGEAWEDAW